jgi:hypothetical protein
LTRSSGKPTSTSNCTCSGGKGGNCGSTSPPVGVGAVGIVGIVGVVVGDVAIGTGKGKMGVGAGVVAVVVGAGVGVVAVVGAVPNWTKGLKPGVPPAWTGNARTISSIICWISMGMGTGGVGVVVVGAVGWAVVGGATWD